MEGRNRIRKGYPMEQRNKGRNEDMKEARKGRGWKEGTEEERGVNKETKEQSKGKRKENMKEGRKKEGMNKGRK